MANFFVDKESFKNDNIKITGEEAAHMTRVLRMGSGDAVTLFDGCGNVAEAVIEEAKKDGVTVRVLSRKKSETEPRLKITLFQGIPKNPKMEFIIQKATEIGVCRIVPVMTKRSVAKIEKDAKIERLRKIAFEAAKQCGRSFVPEVSEPMGFEEAIEEAKLLDAAVIPYECAREGSLEETVNGEISSLGIFIGPEGGFEESEAEKAANAGARQVTLGKRILRTETAGLVTAAVCLYLSGDMR